MWTVLKKHLSSAVCLRYRGKREILAKYPLSNALKSGLRSQQRGDAENDGVCVVADDGEEIPLKTQTLIDNHVPDGESRSVLSWKC